MNTFDSTQQDIADAPDSYEPINEMQETWNMMKLWPAKKLASAARKHLTRITVPALDCPHWHEDMTTAEYIKAFDSANSLLPTIYR